MNMEKYLGKTAYCSSFFLISILGANLLTAGLGAQKTDRFCNEHSDICSLYQNKQDNSTLTDDVTETAYTNATFISSLMTFFPLLCLVFVSLIINHVTSIGPDSQKREEPSSAEHSDRFFSPVQQLSINRYKIALFVASCIYFPVLSVLSTLSTANSTANAICKTNNTNCDIYFPDANLTQLNDVNTLSNSTYSDASSAGILFGILSCVAITLLSISLAAYMNCNQAADGESQKEYVELK